MDLKIKNGFMKGIVNFFVERYFRKNFGVKTDFGLKNLSVTTDERGMSHVDVAFGFTNTKGIINSFVKRYLKQSFAINADFNLKDLSITKDENGIPQMNVLFEADMKETELDKVISNIKD